MTIVFGITGSMAAGKSTCARSLKAEFEARARSVNLVDVDAIRGRLLSARGDRELHDRICEICRADLLLKGGGIDRLRLSELYYYDDALRIRYDAFWDVYLAGVVASELAAPADIKILDWALIAEKSALALTEFNIILVDCRREVQLDRMKDGDLPHEQVVRRIARQMSASEKEASILEQQRVAGRGWFLKISGETIDLKAQAKELVDSILRFPTVAQ
jgi:dephospho-CoA kinase